MSTTISEIAELAGVSKTTVSLVINGNAEAYRISKKTQKKILEIVDKTNFVPDQYARGFRLKKTQTIGLVVPDLRNWFFSQIAYEVEAIAREAQCQVLIACSDDNEEKEFKIIHNLHARRIDSLIIASLMKKDRIAAEILSLNIPVVYIDRRIESDKISWVASDNYQGSYDLVNYVCSNGLQNLAFIGGIKNISTSINRLRGYKDALSTQGITFDPSLVYQQDFTISSGYAMVQNLLEKKKDRIDGIYTSSLTLLEGALKYLDEAGLLASKSVVLATYDDHPFLDYLTLKIPSVQQNTAELARKAIEMIDNMHEGKQITKHQVVKPLLITRE